MKSRVRALPNKRARPSVVIAVNSVAPKLKAGSTLKPKASNFMNPTLASTTGTAAIASRYPASHATNETTANSRRTIPLKSLAVAPITR